MSQTMLLTKPLSTFLSQNVSPQLPTLLLISPTGKLLSSSSPLPASILRSQSTIACTHWDIYQNSNLNDRIAPTLPGVAGQASSSRASSLDLASMVLQLTQGVMVIRALSCGLLFVAIGPSITPSATPNSQALVPPQVTSSQASPQASPPHHEGHEGLEERVASGGSLAVGSENGSVRSSVTSARTQASILGIKRQADEIGRWLENSLKGLVLSTADRR